MRQVSNGTVDYFIPDHQGSTRVMTTATAADEEDIAYTPFGSVASNTGSIDEPYKFTGKEADSNGLYFYESRYYDPVVSTFAAPDAIAPDMTDSQSLNRYAYALNNPVNHVDPTGNFSIHLGSFFRHAFGNVGTAALGVAVQFFVPIVGPELGTAILTQSRTGRDVLAGEIVAGTVAVAAICGPCGTIADVGIGTIAQGALIGEITMGALGAESAAISNGDISKGLLEGVVVGAITGGFGGYTNAAFEAPALGSTEFSSHLVKFVLANYATREVAPLN